MQYPHIDIYIYIYIIIYIYIYIYIYILSILLLSYGTDKENSKSQASLVRSHFLYFPNLDV